MASPRCPRSGLLTIDDYAEAVISAIHGAGGDVLKLIGDGVLAIFNAGDAAPACVRHFGPNAIRALASQPEERRKAADAPVASIYLGPHTGDVFYGNIGARDRLDFTVVGPAVNKTNRISSMCTSVGRDFFVSSDSCRVARERAARLRLSWTFCAARGRQGAGAFHALS